jgi:hypothetical protein
MKVVATGELLLHPQATTEDIVWRMLHKIKAEDPEVLLLAGDLAYGVQGFRRVLQLARAVMPEVRIGVAPGPVDVYSDPSVVATTRELHDKVLPACAKEAGAIWLPTEVLKANGFLFVGTLGWTDYGAAPEGYDIAAHRKDHPDATRVDWGAEDGVVAHGFAERLLSLLEAHSKQTLQAIVVSGCPLGLRQIPPKTHPLAAGMRCNAKLGERVYSHSGLVGMVSAGLFGDGVSAEFLGVRQVTCPSTLKVPGYVVMNCDHNEHPAITEVRLVTAQHWGAQ